VNQLVEMALQRGIKVGGISTPEFRLPSGKRGGFLIQNVATGKKRIMASIGFSSPIYVGRYGVNLEAIQDVGVTAISSAVAEADLVIIDEIGKMELAVPEFLSSVTKALNSEKPVIGTIGLRINMPYVTSIKNRSDVSLIILTLENRRQIYEDIKNLIGL
jgi:nucleoside-triphosphatase